MSKTFQLRPKSEDLKTLAFDPPVTIHIIFPSTLIFVLLAANAASPLATFGNILHETFVHESPPLVVRITDKQSSVGSPMAIPF
ncbi:MAG: Uncharacterised protein [Flavobacterium sp. SCGC AAA160-P02]|nr:MAG: Uncharacterised protein [Flavobacterium sp. SCGC AAA160-P02]